jgi:hypothetical protein
MDRHVPCWNVFRVEGEGTGTRERKAVIGGASGTDRLPAWSPASHRARTGARAMRWLSLPPLPAPRGGRCRGNGRRAR